MEFHAEQAVALYDMLKQVLCHYIGTQRLAYYQALAACVPAWIASWESWAGQGHASAQEDVR